MSLRDYWEKAGGQGKAPGWPSDGGGGTVLDGGVGGVLFPSSGPTALNTRAKNVLPARRGGGISEIKISSAVPGTDSFVTTVHHGQPAVGTIQWGKHLDILGYTGKYFYSSLSYWHERRRFP